LSNQELTPDMSLQSDTNESLPETDDLSKSNQTKLSPSVDLGKNTDLPPLSVDNINTSFKVIADLLPNTKLKVVDKTHLSAEDSMVSSLSRHANGQSRETIINFLEHLFRETERNMYHLLKEIRNGQNENTNISSLGYMTLKLATFLHRYDNMRNVYKTDSSTHARLGNIRDNFFTFYMNLIRNMCIPDFR